MQGERFERGVGKTQRPNRARYTQEAAGIGCKAVSLMLGCPASPQLPTRVET